MEMILREVPRAGEGSLLPICQLRYDVGIAFDKRRSWNRKRFAPMHLLEVPVGDCGGGD